MKKITTTKLLGLLVFLLLVYAGTEFFSSTGRSRSFRDELISFAPEKVSRIQITKGGSNTLLSKSEQEWQVSEDDSKSYKAQEDRIQSMLSSLQTVKPSRVASRNPEKWQEFQVDSAGTRVQVFEGKKKVLDIVLGRFGMQGQQQFYSYVRLFEEDNVYVADNFMGFSVSTDVANYRNQTVATFNKDSVNSIRFHYPGDSSFSLQMSISGNWISETFTPDSVKIAQFIGTLSRLTSSKFENNLNLSGLEAQYTTIVEIEGKDPIELQAIVQNDSTFIVTSNQNEEGQFNDPSLFEKIFKAKSSLYTDSAPEVVE